MEGPLEDAQEEAVVSRLQVACQARIPLGAPLAHRHKLGRLPFDFSLEDLDETQKKNISIKSVVDGVHCWDHQSRASFIRLSILFSLSLDPKPSCFSIPFP